MISGFFLKHNEIIQRFFCRGENILYNLLNVLLSAKPHVRLYLCLAVRKSCNFKLFFDYRALNEVC